MELKGFKRVKNVHGDFEHVPIYYGSVWFIEGRALPFQLIYHGEESLPSTVVILSWLACYIFA